MEMHNTENAISYLTRSTDGGRGLSKDVIEFYRVGVRTEKFRQADGTFNYEECIAFPIYAKRMNSKPKSKVTNQRYADGQVADADTIINNDQYE